MRTFGFKVSAIMYQQFSLPSFELTGKLLRVSRVCIFPLRKGKIEGCHWARHRPGPDALKLATIQSKEI